MVIRLKLHPHMFQLQHFRVVAAWFTLERAHIPPLRFPVPETDTFTTTDNGLLCAMLIVLSYYTENIQ